MSVEVIHEAQIFSDASFHMSMGKASGALPKDAAFDTTGKRCERVREKHDESTHTHSQKSVESACLY